MADARPSSTSAGKQTRERRARGGGLRRRGQAASRPRGRPRRGGRRTRRDAWREEPRDGRRRRREAVAPEGHGPGRAGHDPRAAVDRRRRRLPAAMRSFELKVNRKARKAALRSALSPTPHAARSRSSTPAAFGETPSTKSAAGFLADVGQGRPLLVVVTPEEVGHREVVPQPRRALVLETGRPRGRCARLGALAAPHRGRAREGEGDRSMSRRSTRARSCSRPSSPRRATA